MIETTDNEGVRVASVPRCYLCSARGEILYTGLRDWLLGVPGLWRFLRCPRCQLVWLDPRPDGAELARLYANYYTHTQVHPLAEHPSQLKTAVKRGVLAAALGYDEAARSRTERAAGELLSWFAPMRELVSGMVMWLDGSRRGRLLDVGCGSGAFLLQMRELGWETVGLDPDPDAVLVARDRYGLDVRLGTLDGAVFPDRTFDVVTMSHVIEHVPDPIMTLRECHRVLKNGGRAVIVTPNIQSLGRRWFDEAWRGLEPPRHFFLYSPETLTTCAERAGMQVEQARTTAKGAALIWHASRSGRGCSASSGALVSDSVRPKWSAGGLLFWGLEHLLLQRLAWGEEIVLHASRK